MDESAVLLPVRDGELVDTGSWMYAWLRPDVGRPVIYVGGTGLPPAARIWLHLHSTDPEVGWIAARYPDVAAEPLDVLALPVDPALPRPPVRAAVIERLAAADLLSERYVGIRPDPVAPNIDVSAVAERMVAAVRRYRERGG